MKITYELQQRGIYTLNGVQVGYDRRTTGPESIRHILIPISVSDDIGAGPGEWIIATQEELKALVPAKGLARMNEAVIQRLYPDHS